MGGCIWKSDDGYSRGIVREIRDCCVVVRGREDVDCERSGAEQARVVVGGIGKWHGVAGREDSVAGGGGVGSGRKRRGADEQDDGRGDDDNDGHADNDDDSDADNDDDDDDCTESGCSSLFLFDIYV